MADLTGGVCASLPHRGELLHAPEDNVGELCNKYIRPQPRLYG